MCVPVSWCCSGSQTRNVLYLLWAAAKLCRNFPSIELYNCLFLPNSICQLIIKVDPLLLLIYITRESTEFGGYGKNPVSVPGFSVFFPSVFKCEHRVLTGFLTVRFKTRKNRVSVLFVQNFRFVKSMTCRLCLKKNENSINFFTSLRSLLYYLAGRCRQ